MFVRLNVGNNLFSFQEGVSEPPSISAISRLLRGNGRREDPDSKKDYTINGILGGEFKIQVILSIKLVKLTIFKLYSSGITVY